MACSLLDVNGKEVATRLMSHIPLLEISIIELLSRYDAADGPRHSPISIEKHHNNHGLRKKDTYYQRHDCFLNSHYIIIFEFSKSSHLINFILQTELHIS